MSTNIDLFGWDTVFATSYQQVNQAIVQAKSTPPTFSYTDTTAGLSLSGTWGDWQLTTGGVGQNIQMRCPITKGQAQAQMDTTTLSADISEGWLQIQVELSWLPDQEATTSDPTGTGGNAQQLMVKGSDQAVVSVIDQSLPNATGLLAEALPAAFASWFNANIANFHHVFAIVLLNVQAEQGAFQWLKPTSTGYACINAADSSLEKSVFAVLCLTENEPDPFLTHAVDPRLLENLPADANSAFAISGEEVVRHMLLPGAIYSIDGSQASNFDITNDNLWVVNNTDLTWGNFQLEDGNIVQPTIKTGNFQLGLQGDKFVAKVTDASFPWPGWKGPGHITVHLTYTQEFSFTLQQTAQGWQFVPVAGPNVKDVSASVTSDQAVLDFDIGIGIAGAIAGAVLGAIFSALLEAVGPSIISRLTSLVQGSDYAFSIEMAEVPQTVANASTDAVQQADRDGAQTASQSIQAVGKSTTVTQRFLGTLSASKWKVLGGIIGSIAGAQLGNTSKIVTSIAQGDFADVPPFDTFATNCIGTTTWPFTTDWQIKGANLQGPLVIAGKLIS